MSEKTLRKVKRQLPLYLMALPGLIYLLINNYIPMSGLVVAFKNFNFKDGIYSSPWCGFQIPVQHVHFVCHNPQHPAL